MSTARTLFPLVLVLACAGCAGTQAAAGGAAAPPSDAARAPAGGEGTRAEPAPTPEADVGQIAADARYVTQRLAKGRRERDVVLMICLNDKLDQLHVAERTAVESREGLRRALARGDEDEALHERTRLALLRGRADRLVEESDYCVAYDMGA